ncbi:hypothetical protein GHT06_008829 [Daphnia sinensis]|uniref:Peptidase aspartic putative domain-containing protein n=1 Tax=Daphnia sinensis TaxID=1820382 RepID=A0AAD5Q104_9CRUS|nr:hypothetical protein GHT06_008829 [Daphnia sinensis]
MPNAYGELLVCLLTDKLAIDVRRNLTRQQGKADWSLDELRAAIKQEIEIMGDSNDQIRPTMNQVLFSTSNTTKKKVCPYCTGKHYPTNCTEIKGPDERSKMAKLEKLCFNCLSSTHTTIKDCPSRFRCQRCQQPHHTSLHNQKKGTNTAPQTNTSFHTGSTTSKSLPFVFLKTAVATVGSRSSSFFANLLIDEESQLTFITTRLVKILRLHTFRRVLLSLSGFKGIPANTTEPNYYDVVNFWLYGSNGEHPYRTLASTLPHLKNLQLAHPPSTDNKFSVDILIGPTAVNSFIGYLISGPLPEKFTTAKYSSYAISTIQHDDISRLWSLETLGILPENKISDSTAAYQLQSISFCGNQYTARLPWKNNHPELPSNYLISQRRTRHTVKTLQKKPKLFLLYNQIIRDQLASNFIEKVPRSLQTPGGCHYI